MPKQKKPKRTRSKPVSLYGIPFEKAIEGLLKTKPPEKNQTHKPRTKKKREDND